MQQVAQWKKALSDPASNERSTPSNVSRPVDLQKSSAIDDRSISAWMF
jgi:hypothetical protein